MREGTATAKPQLRCYACDMTFSQWEATNISCDGLDHDWEDAEEKEEED